MLLGRQGAKEGKVLLGREGAIRKGAIRKARCY